MSTERTLNREPYIPPSADSRNDRRGTCRNGGPSNLRRSMFHVKQTRQHAIVTMEAYVGLSHGRNTPYYGPRRLHGPAATTLVIE
jgi:hypothetical protein